MGTDSTLASALPESKSGHKRRPVHDLRAPGRTPRRGTKRPSWPGERLERVQPVFEPPAGRQQGTVGRDVDPRRHLAPGGRSASGRPSNPPPPDAGAIESAIRMKTPGAPGTA